MTAPGLVVVGAVAPAPSDPFLEEAIAATVRALSSYRWSPAEIALGYVLGLGPLRVPVGEARPRGSISSARARAGRRTRRRGR